MDTIRTGTLELGGETFELRATMGAIARWQRAAKDAGVDLGDMQSAPAEMGGAMIWSLMSKKDRDKYGPEDLLDMMTVSAFTAAMEVAADLVAGSMPEDEGEGKSPAKPKAKG